VDITIDVFAPIIDPKVMLVDITILVLIIASKVMLPANILNALITAGLALLLLDVDSFHCFLLHLQRCYIVARRVLYLNVFFTIENQHV
jgi:hypothetical protein